MKKQYSFLLLFTLSAFISQASVLEKNHTIHFASDQHTLTAEHVVSIQKFITELPINGDFEFIIKGHTDQDGSSEYNLILSEKRAQTIHSFLAGSGIERELIAMQFAGEFELLSRSIHSVAKQKNRRVDITFRKYEFENLSEIQDALKQNNITKVKMNPVEEFLLVGKSGTFIKVEPNAFVDSEGNTYSGEVELVLEEALSMADFATHGLSTLADGEILVSGGMFKIEALTAAGTPLLLDPNAPLRVAMPSANMQDGMNVFTSQTGDDWTITDQEPQTQFALNLPPRPQLTFQQYFRPVYTPDESGKPYRPYEPREPKEPRKPNSDNYEAHVQWWQLYKKNSMENKAAERYQNALNAHDLKMDKYHDKYEKFIAYEKAYPKMLHDYIQNMKAWEDTMEQRAIDFTDEYLPEHLAEWQDAVGERKEIYERDCEKWRLECDEVTEKFLDEMDEMGIPDGGQAARYAFSQARLGWLNIDKFRKPGPVRKIIVSTPNPSNEEYVMLYFSESFSCFHMPLVDDMRIQDGVPQDEDMIVVAYKIENGQVMYSEVDASHTGDIRIEYEPIKFTEFRKRLKFLGRA